MPPVRFGDGNSYEAGRPSYPGALIDDVVELCEPTMPRILEIGAGTGKATVLMAQRGPEVLAIEPSPSMAAVATERCSGYSNVSVVVSSFEDWPLERGGFGLVASAQAWHWLSPEIRFRKASQALTGGGHLALFWSHPRWDLLNERASLICAYEEAAPELGGCGPWFPAFSGPPGAEKPTQTEVAGLFGSVEVRRYKQELTYDASAFTALLRSFPEHERLPHERRERLFDAVASVVVNAGGLRLVIESRLYSAGVLPH